MPSNVYRESKYLANPNMPSNKASRKDASLRAKFSAVILADPKLGEIPTKDYKGGKMDDKTHTYQTKGTTYPSETDIARWFDHRFLMRRRLSPAQLPNDVREHIMSAVEDMRAAYFVKNTGIRYNVEALLDNKSGMQESVKKSFMYGGFGFAGLPHEFAESSDAGLEEDQIKQRFASETAGVLMAIRYLESPLRPQVQTQIDKTFSTRMLLIVGTIDDMMGQSDLSFADAHHLGRLLEALLSELPQNPASPPPLSKPTVGTDDIKLPSGASASPRDPSKPLTSNDPVEERELVDPSDLPDTVDWDNIGRFTRYSGNVSSQLRRMVDLIGDTYSKYYRTGRQPEESWFKYVPQSSYMGYGTFGRYGDIARKDDFLKEDNKVAWGSMKVESPRLTHTTVKPRDCGRDHRHIARESGRVPRFMHRFLSDGRVFSQKKRRRGGIALLCDQSGSMCLSYGDIDNVLKKIPASIIAGYAGHGATGTLRVLAKDGRRVDGNAGLINGGMNVVDLPALQWLARQGNAGKYWLSDGIVTGQHDSNGPGNYKEVDDFIVENDIYQVTTIEKLLRVIFDGEELGKRTMQLHFDNGSELLTT